MSRVRTSASMLIATALLTAVAAHADTLPGPAPAAGEAAGAAVGGAAGDGAADAVPASGEDAQAQKEAEEFARAVGLQKGPLDGDMGVARVRVPEGFVFADGDGARRWATITTNPVSKKEIGLVGPADDRWLILFEFDDVGYVKDDEKDALDADELLASFQEGNAAFNEERVRAGMPPLNILGWEQKPAYNEAAHALEWCLRAESAGEPMLNFNTRLLGRRGVVSVTLMFGGDVKLADVLPEFRAFLRGFSFKEGETYAEFREGDKLAEYGLAALVAGGGVALAAKSGLLAKLGMLFAKGGKAILVGLVALVGGVASMARRFFGRRSSSGEG